MVPESQALVRRSPRLREAPLNETLTSEEPKEEPLRLSPFRLSPFRLSPLRLSPLLKTASLERECNDGSCAAPPQPKRSTVAHNARESGGIATSGVCDR